MWGQKQYLDLIKGICAILVIWEHSDIWCGALPKVYPLFISFIMFPSFFIVSGYLINPKKTLAESLYYRIGKLLVLYIIMAYCSALFNFSLIKSSFYEPGILLQKIFDTTIRILSGKALWFVACLIVIQIFLLICIHLTKNNLKILSIISILTAVLGYLLCNGEEMLVWNVDTAAICQLFCFIGYMIKLKWEKILEKINLKFSLLVLAVYTIMVVFISNITYCDFTVNVVLKKWGILPVTIVMMFIGNVMLFTLCRNINKGKLISYIGKHSLLYLAIASHFGSIAAKLLFMAVKVTNFKLLLSPAISSILVSIGATLMMAVFCMAVDIYIPWLNGGFTMPSINKKLQY